MILAFPPQTKCGHVENPLWDCVVHGYASVDCPQMLKCGQPAMGLRCPRVHGSKRGEYKKRLHRGHSVLAGQRSSPADALEIRVRAETEERDVSKVEEERCN